MGIPDWRQELRVAQKGTAISFLTFLLDTYRIKSAGTGWQYFRQWKQREYKSVTATRDSPLRLGSVLCNDQTGAKQE